MMKLKDGDIFLYTTDSFISKAITEAQSIYWSLFDRKSYFSHTGFLFPSRKEIVHSTVDYSIDLRNIFSFGKKPILKIESGIQVDPIDVVYKQKMVMVVRLKLTAAQRKKLMKIAYQMATEDHKYPIHELFGTLFAILMAWALNKPKWALKKNILDNPTQYYCSAFVTEALRRAGLNVWNCIDPSATTVDHLYYIDLEKEICGKEAGSPSYADLVESITPLSEFELV